MIPYLEQPTLRLGPLTIAAFGVIVATSVWVGLVLGRRRFDRLGLDPALGEGLAWWVVAGGFVSAHLFSVLLYFPHEVAENPLLLLKLWEDISSFGGIVGGALALWLFLRRRAPHLDVWTRWAYADVVASVFPVSLMIGRVACALAHDHPGTVTAFPLAVSLARPEARAYLANVYANAGRSADLPPPDVLARLGFHDLGWYEFLYLAAVVVPVALLLARRPRRPGAFLVGFVALYMPVRFLLDFLRVSDARYAGLTPAQWTALLALGGLAVAWPAFARGRPRGATPIHAPSPSPRGPSPAPRTDFTPMDHTPGRSLPAPKRAAFWWTAAVVVLTDVVTKYLAHTRLQPVHRPHEVLGDVVRLTLSYNPGAAFGMHVGAASRAVFTVLTALILGVLWRLYRDTQPADRWRALALGLVVGGALGNLVNRFWSARGVVDFLDLGVGDVRFWTFNVADVGVSVGAVVLVLVLWREDVTRARSAAAADDGVGSSGSSPESPLQIPR